MHNLNVSVTNLDCGDVSHNISKKYCQINDNKLLTYSKIYDSFRLQSYLSFGLPKSLTKEITKKKKKKKKNRISAHDLLTEHGRYFRSRIPREQRIFVQYSLTPGKLSQVRVPPWRY